MPTPISPPALFTFDFIHQITTTATAHFFASVITILHCHRSMIHHRFHYHSAFSHYHFTYPPSFISCFLPLTFLSASTHYFTAAFAIAQLPCPPLSVAHFRLIVIFIHVISMVVAITHRFIHLCHVATSLYCGSATAQRPFGQACFLSSHFTPATGLRHTNEAGCCLPYTCFSLYFSWLMFFFFFFYITTI